MLTDDNYTVWAIKVEANLDPQGIWEAVVPADSTAAVDPKKNKMARAYLLGALVEDILLQVSSKKMPTEVWASHKARFVGADRVRAARLSTLRGDFDRLTMADGEALDVYAGKISGMAAKYANLGATLSDAEMMKKLLDTVPDALYTAVAGIEQFCEVETVCFDGVNSKKPHLRGKYLEPPVFSEIAKNHRFYVNSFQCALIVKLRQIDTISDNRVPLPG
jgi:hypothetical protein